MLNNERSECDSASVTSYPLKIGYQSISSGFDFLINSHFQSFLQALSCFSRAIASDIESNSSTYKRIVSLYFEVNFDPSPCL